MKQVTLQRSTGRVEVVDVPPPEVPKRGVLVATTASVISHGTERSKVDTAGKSLIGKARERPDQVAKVIEAARTDGPVAAYQLARTRLNEPGVLGYSLCGEVTAVGLDGGPFKPGGRVACAGAEHAHHAGMVAIPKNLAALVPDAVSDEAASYAAIGSVALNAIRQSGAGLGDVVAIIGLGLVGQLAAQLATAAGCVVVGLDPNEEKSRLASLSSSVITATDGDAFASAVAEASRGFGADTALLCALTQDQDVIKLATRMLRDRGRVVVVGDVDLVLPRDEFYAKDLELRMTRSYGPGRYDTTYERDGVDLPIGYVRWTEQRNLYAFLDLCARGSIDPCVLTTHRFDVADAAEAYRVLKDQDSVGVLLTYRDEGRRSLAPAPQPAKRSTQPMQNLISVGFLGAGRFATRTLIPAFLQAGTKVSSIASSKGLSARTAAEQFRIDNVVSGLEELVATGIRAVVVSTPHDLHAEQVIASANAGLDVFCEKPLCIDPQDLERVQQAVFDAGVLCFVGFNRRYAPLTRSALEHFGAVSEPRQVLIRVNARPSADHWLADTSVGGGMWIGEGCHFVDLASVLVGAQPKEVTAHALVDRGGQSRGMQASYGFLDGSTATIVYGDVGSPDVEKELVEVHAGGRSVVVKDFKTASFSGGGKRRAVRGRRADKGHDAEVAAFVGALKDGRQGFSDGSIASMRATFAAVEAASRGERVSIE